MRCRSRPPGCRSPRRNRRERRHCRRESAPSATRRCGWCSRRRAAPRSNGATASGGAAASVSRQYSASARSAASLRAERISGGSSVPRRRRPRRCRRDRGGTPSTACPLVPPNPNELTPAQRPSAIASLSRTSRKLSSSNGICGFGVSQCSDGGTTPRSRESAALISPAMPDAGSRWPILVLTDPIGSVVAGPGRARARPRRPRSDRRPACRCRASRKTRNRPA